VKTFPDKCSRVSTKLGGKNAGQNIYITKLKPFCYYFLNLP